MLALPSHHVLSSPGHCMLWFPHYPVFWSHHHHVLSLPCAVIALSPCVIVTHCCPHCIVVACPCHVLCPHCVIVMQYFTLLHEFWWIPFGFHWNGRNIKFLWILPDSQWNLDGIPMDSQWNLNGIPKSCDLTFIYQ